MATKVNQSGIANDAVGAAQIAAAVVICDMRWRLTPKRLARSV